MKRRPNPIRGTVTNWISTRPKIQKPNITLLVFFNDLESRGPFNPNSLFRQWTSSIRLDMIEAGTWLKKTNPAGKVTAAFVQEYISRLQVQFWKTNNLYEIETEKIFGYSRDISLPYWSDDLDNNTIRTFKTIYKMIRVFGLRMKLFYLLKPRLYRGMKYRHLLVGSIVTRYSFGKEYMEKAWSCYRAKRDFERRKNPYRTEMYFCAPLKMSLRDCDP